jgi:hypothetical protein
MKRFLLIIFLLCMVSFVHASVEHTYIIDIQYDNGSVSYTSVRVRPSTETPPSTQGGWIAETVSVDNVVLDRISFDFPGIIYYDAVDDTTERVGSGGYSILNGAEITLLIPYFSNAKEINIYDSNLERKLVIDVSSFAKERTVKVDAVDESTPVDIQKEQVTKKDPLTQQLTGMNILKGVALGLGIIILLILIIIFFIRKKNH